MEPVAIKVISDVVCNRGKDSSFKWAILCEHKQLVLVL